MSWRSYANRWFGGLSDEVRDSGVALGQIRLAAAVGGKVSPDVHIPRPDSIAERYMECPPLPAAHLNLSEHRMLGVQKLPVRPLPVEASP